MINENIEKINNIERVPGDNKNKKLAEAKERLTPSATEEATGPNTRKIIDKIYKEDAPSAGLKKYSEEEKGRTRAMEVLAQEAVITGSIEKTVKGIKSRGDPQNIDAIHDELIKAVEKNNKNNS